MPPPPLWQQYDGVNHNNEVILELLSLGASPDVKESQGGGWTALHFAFQRDGYPHPPTHVRTQVHKHVCVCVLKHTHHYCNEGTTEALRGIDDRSQPHTQAHTQTHTPIHTLTLTNTHKWAPKQPHTNNYTPSHI